MRAIDRAEVLSYTAWQNLCHLIRYYFAVANYLAGFKPPDPRDQNLKDLGAELEWRVSVIRNTAKR
jgi:hypothetical protein